MGYLTIAKFIGLAALLIGSFAMGFKASSEIQETKIARFEQKVSEQSLKRIEAVNAQLLEERKEVVKLSLEKALLEQDYDNRFKKLSADLNVAHTNGARMRELVLQYTNRVHTDPKSGDTSTICSVDDRTKTLGVLLTEADGLAEEGLGSAARYSDQIVGLKGYITRVCKPVLIKAYGLDSTQIVSSSH